jgi:hyaluronoglucosaminidase
MNVIKKQFYFLTIVFLLVSGIVSPFSNVVTANEAPSSNSTEDNQYEIYPLPQNQTYLGTNFTVTDVVNIVIEPTIDASTSNFLNKILESKSIGATISEEVVSDKTNILIGTKNSKGYVENYVNKNIEYDSAIFNELDAHIKVF